MKNTKEIELYLKNYACLGRQILECEADLKELLTKKEDWMQRCLGAVRYETEKISSGAIADPVYAAVEKVVDVYAKQIETAAQTLAALQTKKNAYKSLLRSAHLTESEQKMIHLRYFKKMTVSAVALSMGYSPENVYRLRKTALRKLAVCA